MKAIIHSGKTGITGLQYINYIEEAPGKNDVKIRLKTSGLNHRDLFLILELPPQENPVILGSDGAGIIEAVGESVTDWKVGEEVIINPCLGWNKRNEVPAMADILGFPKNGTFADSVIVPQENITRKPTYLTWEEAGGLSLAALTAYRALFTKGNLKEGDHVLIPGIGGGVATFAALMASAIKAQVTVTSRNEIKRQKALQFPVTRALNSHANWVDEIGKESVDLIVDSIGSATFNQYFDVIKPNGNIVVFGASSGDKLQISMRNLFFPQINIKGTSMGSQEEFSAMINFMEKHKIRPIIDTVFPLHDAALAFERMERSEQLGNIILLNDQN